MFLKNVKIRGALDAGSNQACFKFNKDRKRSSIWAAITVTWLQTLNEKRSTEDTKGYVREKLGAFLIISGMHA